MFIISWNVAGLSTTLARINNDYKSASIPASKRSRCHAFEDYIERHGNPDVLCIQEHKIPLKQLSSRSEPFGCSMLKGYESFWACCVDKTKRGFNGVVTYAKCGTVQYADSRPFNCDELDDQGRVVMTDHGSFVIFNVYAPASCGMPLSYKMQFLNALKRAMTKQRSKGKRVILVGDLNISHLSIDVYWKYRFVNVNNILQESQTQEPIADKKTSSLSDPVPNKWKLQVKEHWEKIQAALSRIDAVAVNTKNVATGVTFEKYRARVQVGKPGSERKILLGGHESSADSCLSCFCFSRKFYFDKDLNKQCIAREENVVRLDILTELMAKIARVQWDTSTLRKIAQSEGLRQCSPTTNWLGNMMKDDSMVDALRYIHPKALGRYTCWDQYTNKRFSNIGARLDYTIIDSTLTKYLDVESSQRLRCCNYPDAENKFDSEEAGLHAAVASGMFEGASFHGGGIAAATDKALQTQFGIPHTGIIYTAPQYSDHVAVSLLLNDGFREMVSTSFVLNGKETKQAQPHKAQKSISSYFAGNKSLSPSSSPGTSSAKRTRIGEKTKNKRARGTIMAHFARSIKK